MNCGADEAHRFDVWQGGVTALLAGGIPKDKERDGQIVTDIHPLGSFPKSGIDPHVVLQQCYSCSAEENPCDCIDRQKEAYRYKDTYRPLGPNSNTFVGSIAADCGLIGQAPSSKAKVPSGAVGWWWDLEVEKREPVMPNPERDRKVRKLEERGRKAKELRDKYEPTTDRPKW